MKLTRFERLRGGAGASLRRPKTSELELGYRVASRVLALEVELESDNVVEPSGTRRD